MDKRVAFIGHRKCLPPDICLRITDAIKKEIENGCKTFTMGTHGEFDKLALSTCLKYKSINKDIEIEVVITSLHQIPPIKNKDTYFNPYENIKTVMYNIEEVYFKEKITLSNQEMIDTCDVLICYVRPQKLYSGAKTAMNYAKRKGLKIVNLFKENDF